MIPHILAFSSFLKLNSMRRGSLLSLWGRPAGPACWRQRMDWDGESLEVRGWVLPRGPAAHGQASLLGERQLGKHPAATHHGMSSLDGQGETGTRDSKTVLPRQGPEWGTAGGVTDLTAAWAIHEQTDGMARRINPSSQLGRGWSGEGFRGYVTIQVTNTDGDSQEKYLERRAG